ncbi:hypothetical protein QCN27_18500 [Cereibacter sp. SYSU M97828]|nr:hypothetical protein [Cereibacter flavus]
MAQVFGFRLLRVGNTWSIRRLAFHRTPHRILRQANRTPEYLVATHWREVPQVCADIHLIVRTPPPIVHMPEKVDRPIATPVPSEQRIVAQDKALTPILHFDQIVNTNPWQTQHLIGIVIAAHKVFTAGQRLEYPGGGIRCSEIAYDPQVIIRFHTRSDTVDHFTIHSVRIDERTSEKHAYSVISEMRVGSIPMRHLFLRCCAEDRRAAQILQAWHFRTMSENGAITSETICLNPTQSEYRAK